MDATVHLPDWQSLIKNVLSKDVVKRHSHILLAGTQPGPTIQEGDPEL